MGTGKLLGKPNKLREVTCDGLVSHPGGVEILLATSCYRNQDKLQQLLASHGSKVSLHFFHIFLPFLSSSTVLRVLVSGLNKLGNGMFTAPG